MLLERDEVAHGGRVDRWQQPQPGQRDGVAVGHGAGAGVAESIGTEQVEHRGPGGEAQQRVVPHHPAPHLPAGF